MNLKKSENKYSTYCKYGFFFCIACLLTAACIKKEEATFTYVVDGRVGSVLGRPIPGIQVVMHRSYAQWQESDTAVTDDLGQYKVYMTLRNRQRAFVLDFQDPGIVERPVTYKPSSKQIIFPEQRNRTPLHQYFVIADSLTLYTGIDINP